MNAVKPSVDDHDSLNNTENEIRLINIPIPMFAEAADLFVYLQDDQGGSCYSFFQAGI